MWLIVKEPVQKSNGQYCQPVLFERHKHNTGQPLNKDAGCDYILLNNNTAIEYPSNKPKRSFLFSTTVHILWLYTGTCMTKHLCTFFYFIYFVKPHEPSKTFPWHDDSTHWIWPRRLIYCTCCHEINKISKFILPEITFMVQSIRDLLCVKKGNLANEIWGREINNTYTFHLQTSCIMLLSKWKHLCASCISSEASSTIGMNATYVYSLQSKYYLLQTALHRIILAVHCNKRVK